MKHYTLIRITTIPLSLDKLLGGQLSFMRKSYNTIAVSSDKDYLQRIGEKEDVSTFCVDMTRKITPFKDLIALWKLYKFLKKESPFIVHTHTPKAGTLGMIAAKLAAVPNRLHTVAGLPLLEIKGNKRKLLNLVEKITYKCSTHIYPNSNGLKNIIIAEKLCSENKLKVIGNGSSNGINTSYYEPSIFSIEQKEKLKKELNIDERNFIFVFVGRIVSDKGINELIKAFDNMTKKNPNIKLLLIGQQESDLDPLEQETLKIISSNINILSVGFQPDVRPYLAISDALVFPSYREGFPNVVMQAGSMGLPSIVTDINGCNEIIIDGRNGVIIPPKNVSALQEKMELFITNKEFVLKLKSKSREMITSRYEQNIIWEALLAEYKDLERQYKINK